MEARQALDASGESFAFQRPESGELRRKSIRGGISMFTAEGLSYALRVASIIVLARWLAPEDFGLIGMVTALTMFAERFKDLGLDIATVQRERITHQEVSTLFWINLGVGAVITSVIVASAPLIARFYGEPRLFWIAVVLAGTFLVSGATIQHQALLRRQMRFGDLAMMTVLAAAMSFVVGTLLAWYDMGYWALVWREVVRTATMAAVAWVLCAWVPGRPRRSPEIRSMMRVGGNITGFNIVYFLSRSLDQIAIGKVWGAGPLGFYRQSHGLLMLPINLLHFPVDYVALPALSALKGQPDRYRKYYREITALLAFFCMPLLMYLAIYSEVIIVVLLGEKWRPAAPIFSVMAFAGFIWPLSGPSGAVMLSNNKSRRYFWIGVANAVAFSVAVLIGVWWGPVGVAAGYAISTYVTLIPFLMFAFHDTPVSIRDAFEAAARPLIASILTAGLLLLLGSTLSGLQPVPALGASLFITAMAYVGISLAMPGGWGRVTAYVAYARMGLRPATAA
jgi:O-antigen/teichoic acid export membrane protein